MTFLKWNNLNTHIWKGYIKKQINLKQEKLALGQLSKGRSEKEQYGEGRF